MKALKRRQKQSSGGLQVDPEVWAGLQSKLTEINGAIPACFTKRVSKKTIRAKPKDYLGEMDRGKFSSVDYYEDMMKSVIRHKIVSPPSPKVQPGPRSIIEIPNFEFDDAHLPTDTPQTFKDLIDPSFPDKKNVVIESITGHTDRKGSDEYNLTLSESRAESVREALKKALFDVSNVKPIGKSWLEAKKGASRTERRKERKVVIVWHLKASK